MPQVSKRMLRKEIGQRLFKVFYEVLAKYKTGVDTESFFSSLLTPTEQVMMAKRLGIAIMLLNGYSYRPIANSLKVSFGTINRVALWLQQAEESAVRILRDYIESDSEARKILKILHKLIYDITPPKRYGKRIKSPYRAPDNFPFWEREK